MSGTRRAGSAAACTGRGSSARSMPASDAATEVTRLRSYAAWSTLWIERSMITIESSTTHEHDHHRDDHRDARLPPGAVSRTSASSLLAPSQVGSGGADGRREPVRRVAARQRGLDLHGARSKGSPLRVLVHEQDARSRSGRPCWGRGRSRTRARQGSTCLFTMPVATVRHSEALVSSDRTAPAPTTASAAVLRHW